MTWAGKHPRIFEIHLQLFEFLNWRNEVFNCRFHFNFPCRRFISPIPGSSMVTSYDLSVCNKGTTLCQFRHYARNVNENKCFINFN